MLQSLITQTGAVAIATVCTYAFVKGSWRERFGAVIYSLAYLISLGLGLTSTEHAPWYLLVADMIGLLGFYITCWKAQHPWPKWALAGQALSVLISIVALANIGVPRWAFLTLQTTAGWGVLLALLIGTIAVAQERRDMRQLPDKVALRK